jgi:2-C-methyl-D-erythritol 2,4-cyclodiphosphate synthase
MRVGIGYDVHRLVIGRKLVIGGITIPFERGLEGHSDADVLVHAICDALLGAAGMGDIGMHFSDSSLKFKDIFSIELLGDVRRMLVSAGFTINNIDSTLFAEAPRITPYRDAMREMISNTLEIETLRVNIKATTTEGLGFIGRGEGIAAMCVALVEEALTRK